MRNRCIWLAVLISGLSLTAVGQIVLKKGSDIVMTGSAGSRIVFPDGTTMNSAAGVVVPDGHGGTNNTVSGADSFIGGGTGNSTTDDYGTIGGGNTNRVGDNAGTADDSPYGTVGGGEGNIASGPHAAIAGGEANIASGVHSFVGGGYDNSATGLAAAIGGGTENVAEGPHATVVGGNQNIAGGNFTTAVGGQYNTVTGAFSVALGGQFNSAVGSFSFVAGRRAMANYPGCFIWADDSTENLIAPTSKTFLARASNGYYLYTNSTATTGAKLSANASSWSTVSDRNAKTDFEAVDSVAALEKVVAMPVSSFAYKEGDPEVRHIGVMAQDFHAAFDVGSDDLSITTQDADGVAIAAIQGLNAKLESELADRDRIIRSMQAELTALRSQMEAQQRP